MKRIELDQGSVAWHHYRSSHANASEAGAIMGEARFKPATWLELYDAKLGLREFPVYEPATEHGHAWESTARERAEKMLGRQFPPAIVEDGVFSASLDGLSDDLDVLELKCPLSGSRGHVWKDALAGELHPDYGWQVQHQMMIVGVETASFCVYASDIDDIVAVQVRADVAAQELLRSEWLKFWAHLEKRRPPEARDADVVTRKDEDWERAARAYLEATNELEQLEAVQKRARERLVELTGHHASQGAGVRVMPVVSKGSVDYRKLLGALGDPDVEPYRKPSRTSYRVTRT